MIFIIIGILAFVFFYIFDLNKIVHLHNFFNIFFLFGVLFLAYATIGILWFTPTTFTLSLPFKAIGCILSIVSLFLLPYTLFFALPFHKTYLDTREKNQVVDRGMYALCRHPGVLWFFLFYLFLWLTSGKIMVMWAGVIWTIMDILHVYIQDKWIFPKILFNYEGYQNRVPFLIPNYKSIRKFIADYKLL